MTDKKTENSQPSQGSHGPKPASIPTPGSTTAASSSDKTPTAKRRSNWLVPASVALLLLVLLLGAALWYQQRTYQKTSAELTSRVQASSELARQAADQARQALSLAEQKAQELESLQTELRQSQEQVSGLEQAFQTLTDAGSDLVLLNDIDHLLVIAQQQLQLSGNVGNAIISLETAQAQLARANRPALATLLQTINGDLDRLRGASTIDVAALSASLDELGGLVSEAPLMVPDDVAPEVVESERSPSSSPPAQGQTESDPTLPWWRQSLEAAQDWSRDAWETVREDLGQFIAVRRVDDANALLMSPDQAMRFRENMRLRIMTAQLALMMRQPKVWKSETDRILKAVESRYDMASSQSRQALKIARQMADTAIDVRLPTVTNSLQAIEALRAERAKQDSREADTGKPSNGQRQTDTETDTDQPEGPQTEQKSEETGADSDTQPESEPAVLDEAPVSGAPGSEQTAPPAAGAQQG